MMVIIEACYVDPRAGKNTSVEEENEENKEIINSSDEIPDN